MKNVLTKLIPALVFFASHQTFAQPISKGEFRQLFTQGNLMMMEKFYDTASKVFLKLNTAEPSNANVNYKIGICYLNIPGEKRKAISYLENALKQTSGNYLEDDPSEKNAPEDAMYYLGQAYHYAYRFDESLDHFKKFRDLIGKWNLHLVKAIDHWIEMSNNAKELTSKPIECTITNLGDSVNCQYADYSPVISADESILAFTSRRLGTGGELNKTINDEFLEDIWICNRGPYGTWTKAKSISRSINTDNNEATIGLSADGQELYVYRDDNGDGNIYLSVQDGNFWNAPVKIDAATINSKKFEPSACVSADGTTMYFVSDRSGGLGGMDIYQCKLQPDRTWSQPENLGPSINTPYNEDAPFIHPDGTTFFFSSTGHTTMGGFDIFYSTKVAGNVWTTPINMGYPINTTDDDIYFVTSSDGRRAFYASFRPEGKGEKDIYMVSMPKAIVKSVAILVGYLKNKDGSPIPKNSLVTTKSAKGESISKRANEASGKFVQSIFPGQEYSITIEANGKKVFEDKFFLPEDSSYQNLGRGFFQRTILLGDTANLFSMEKASTANTINSEKILMDGTILLSENTNDVGKNIAIQLLNTQGNIIASTVTDNDGTFKFQNLPSDQKYIIKIDETDPILKSKSTFFLADKEKKIVASVSKEGQFLLFKNIIPELNKLTPLEAEDAPAAKNVLRGKLASDDKGKNGLANTTINLLDQFGKIIQKKTTDNYGSFTFEGLPTDQHYTFSINEEDPALKNTQKVYFVNAQNSAINKIEKVGDAFILKNLAADHNKAGSMEEMDAKPVLITMTGKVLSSTNSNDGLVNLDVTLLDNKGKVIEETKTDASGAFVFNKLPSDNNYTIKLNANDPFLKSEKKVYLADESGKIVKAIDVTKKDVSFNKIPANLVELAELKNIPLAASKNEVTEIIHKTTIYPGDENFDFVIYFPYNKKEIDISIGSYLSLTNRVTKTINENGKATIIIAASSSAVPTSTYPSNEALAESRANEIKDKIQVSIRSKSIDESKVDYEISKKVQGPEYKNDAMKNRKEYEKWQYVKVIVK